jgi:hypothetical protein
MNQALSFGLLAGGGILFTKALTGNSWSQIFQGHAGTVSKTGSPLAAAASSASTSGVAGVGTAAAGAFSAVAGAAGKLGAAAKSGYTNPIPGASVGRTDQGVDATLTPGKPIVAVGLSRVVGILQNWYSGQPYIWFQLLNGPQSGRYWYVAEQITPTVKPGQLVAAGQQVGTYSNSGTGLELGWATASGATLARATAPVGPGATPAGQNFRDFLTSLGL